MNSKNPIKRNGMSAQAMVEFAASLLLLLTILYGLLETGRLLFIYASTVTAARQAARYGSATGLGPNGVPFYEDCTGIEAAADAVGFINDFQNISISYDRGFGSGSVTALGACGTYTTPQNGDRIVVDVSAAWEPIVSLVPLPGFVIQKQSSRTILSSISIAVTAVPQAWESTGSGFLEISITPSPSTYTAVGETISVDFTLTNVGADSIDGPFTVQSVSFGVTTCGTGTLVAGASVTCSENYTVTQADIDNGAKTFLAAGLANAVSYSTASATISAIFQPEISLAKSPSTSAISTLGGNITYTYTITNTGNVTLEDAFSVSDNKIPGGANCSGATLPLAPGDSTTCTANYTVTSDDKTNGSIVNEAVATTTFNAGLVTSNTATATVYTTELVILVSPSAVTATLPNQVITYTYTVSNSGGTAVNGLSISDDKATGITCNSTTIASGGSTTCTGTYTLTQVNYDTGGSIVSTAQASANNGAPVSSSQVTTTVVISQIAKLTATISASPNAPTSPATSLPVNTPINYTYALTNTGNVTLKAPFTVTDDKVTITCADTSDFAPGAPARSCIGTRNITAADVDAGAVVNTGYATATFGLTSVQSAPDSSATVVTYSGPRFKVTLAANPTSITQPNALVAFTYTLTNTGGKDLTSPFSITSSLFGTFTCTGTSPLAPGTSTTCQNNTTTSQSLTNTITAASAYDGATLVNATTPLPSVTVPASICNASNLILSSPSGNQTYTWTLTNTTSYILTLNSIQVQWNTAGNKYLHTVTFNTTTIFDGSLSVDDKDGDALYNGTWAVNPGINTLVMDFTKNGVSISNMTLTFAEGSCGPLEKH